MNFIEKLLYKNQPIKNYLDFWNWFQKNERDFYKVVKSGKNIEKKFFSKLTPSLNQLKDGYYFLTGMYDEKTAELVLTADGNTNNIVFVEELVAAAPKIDNWKFTAHKQAMGDDHCSINMGKYDFNFENMFFYFKEYQEYPDEINITVVHNDITANNIEKVGNGIYIFLDNYLGELEFVNNIDELDIKSKNDAEKELIPLEKLKSYLIWRQKEFIEKYETDYYDSETAVFSLLEIELECGNKLLATINTNVLNWDKKASHPWISNITFEYDGKDTNGFPNENDYEMLNIIEDKLIEELANNEGFINIGRQTANNERKIFFACKDFRKPSKVFYNFKKQYPQYNIEFSIYKDKYWQSLERFNNQ